MTHTEQIETRPDDPSHTYCQHRISLASTEGGPEHYAELERLSRTYGAKSTIVNEGDKGNNVFAVLSGWVIASKTFEDGQNQIIDFLLPCDLIEPATAHLTSSAVTLTAQTDAKVAIVPRKKWLRMIAAKPAFETAYEKARAAEIARFSERILRLGKGSASVRVAYALLEICVRLRAIGGTSDHRFHMPLTQQDIGDFTGLTSVHVCRIMRDFVHKGIIEFSDHIDIKILSIDALSEIAGIDVDRLAREITLDG